MKMMLQRINKRLRSEKANTLIENVIILPLIIIVIYFMILASFVIHDRSTLDAAAKRGTIYAARCISDPNYPMILRQSGHQSGMLDTNVTQWTADSFDCVGDNIKPYRYLVMNTADIRDATVNEISNIVQHTKIPWRDIETEDIAVKIDNKIIYQNVEVSITARYPLPKIFGNFGLPTEFHYTVTAATAVNDPDEFIRNVDLVVDVCAAIDRSTGGNIQKVLSKLNEMGTKLTQFLSGEKGFGGSGGAGAPVGGGDYLASAGESGDAENGENSSAGDQELAANSGEEAVTPTEAEELTPQQIRDIMIGIFGQANVDAVSEDLDTSSWTEDDWYIYLHEYMLSGSKPEIPIAPTPTPSVQFVANSYQEYDEAAKEIGKRTDLTDEQKVLELQNLFKNSNYKKDINVPIDAQYVSGFKEDGTIKYDWPPKLGFQEGTMKPISNPDDLPPNWDRYGHMRGDNFSDVPSTGSYTYDERAIPYVENKDAYHTGTFNSATYFDKVDAIKNGDMNALNKILSDEGIEAVDSDFFKELTGEYKNYINKIKENIGSDIDAPYGLMGSAASWGDMCGGAGQYVTPLKGNQMSKIGIMKEST